MVKFWSRNDGFTIHTDKAYLHMDMISDFLLATYWGEGLSKESIKKSIENTPLCYGIYKGNPAEDQNVQQVGFARVITDFTRFAWLSDVFILPKHRGKGLSKWLMEIIVTTPELEGTAFHLATKDAHGLYKQYGFSELMSPENRMERLINIAVIEKNIRS
ncbi:GNAT family N-acetyltransferase [Fictibacillus barbaricus]|uniref:GNAT superfamily N-acetyltransferase n=1 Tax=Fictibacillus barbaricus TaxID=182136 RepID=A0ABU1U152_9BACL|nr:GNAT family N-acetyltransferase [Fictibacillus barbaricus]MDR7073126.1 GNAT superfamily N-acetyltransferase [Fictibacillus barbaricus]